VSQLDKSSSVNLKGQRSRSVGSANDIEEAGLGDGSSQRLAKSDPRNHGSRFGWLFGDTVPQKKAHADHFTSDSPQLVSGRVSAALVSENNTDSSPDDAEDVSPRHHPTLF
jgi:hypothetical protein